MMSRGSSQGLVRSERNRPKGRAAPTRHAASILATRPLASTPATTATTRSEPATPATPDRTARSASTAATPAATSTRTSAGRFTPMPRGRVTGPGATLTPHRRQLDDHAAAMGLAGLDPDVAAVEVDDPAGDGQSEAGATVLRRTGRIGPVEALEHLAPLLLVDAGAFVADLDGDAGPVLGRPQLHRPAGRRVADGVVQQVGQDLVDPGRVAVRRGPGGVDPYRHGHVGGPQPSLAGDVLQERPAARTTVVAAGPPRTRGATGPAAG